MYMYIFSDTFSAKSDLIRERMQPPQVSFEQRSWSFSNTHCSLSRQNALVEPYRYLLEVLQVLQILLVTN